VNPDLGELLPMALLLRVVLTPLELEDDDLVAEPLLDDLGRDRGPLQRRNPDLHVGAVGAEEDVIELDLRDNPHSDHPMSYAIFRSGGKQFRAEKGVTLRLPSLPGEAGAKVEFNDILLGSDGSNVKVGVPTLKGASVTAEIVKQGLGDKIVVFKFKRRKNYAKKQGHRQKFTEVRIHDITLG